MKCGTLNISISFTSCRMFREPAKSRANLNSCAGYTAEFTITARQFSPNVSCTTDNRKVESTPPENPSATLPRSLRIDFSLINLSPNRQSQKYDMDKLIRSFMRIRSFFFYPSEPFTIPSRCHHEPYSESLVPAFLHR